MEVSEDLLIPDKNLSINQGGIRYYKNTVNTENIEWQNFKALLDYYHDKALKDFTKEEMKIILYGSNVPIQYSIVSSGGTLSPFSYLMYEFFEINAIFEH